MENNIDKIINLAHQELDDYHLELISLMILEKRKKNSFSDYELIEARRRLQELADAISYQLDEDQNSSRSSPKGEEIYAPTSYGGNLDDSDIRGTEALGCLYACVRWCVGVVVVIMLAMLMNVMQKSAKKYKKVIDNTILICYTYNIRYEQNISYGQ